MSKTIRVRLLGDNGDKALVVELKSIPSCTFPLHVGQKLQFGDVVLDNGFPRTVDIVKILVFPHITEVIVH